MDKDVINLLAKKNKATKNPDKLILAEAHNDLAIFYRKRNQYAKALAEYEQAVNVVKETVPFNDMEWGFFNKMIGEIHMHLANFEKARQYLALHLEIAVKRGNLIEQQRGKASLGRMFLLQGQSTTDEIERTKYMKEAKYASQESLDLCKRLTGQIDGTELNDMQARALLNIGVAQDNFDNGMPMIEAAVTMCINNKFNNVLIKCYAAKAAAHRDREEYHEALECHDKAINLIKTLKLRNVKTCEILLLKAEIYCEMCDFERARKTLIEAKKKKTTDEQDAKEIKEMYDVVSEICKLHIVIDKSTNPSDHAKLKQLYEKLGDECCKVRSYLGARDCYLKTLYHAKQGGISDKALAPIYVSLYKTYEDMSNYAKALEYVEMEYELIKDNPKEICDTMLNKAEILFLAKRPWEQIETACGEALKAAKLCEASEPSSNDQDNKVKNVQKILKEYREKYPKLVKLVSYSMPIGQDNPSSSGLSDTKEATPGIRKRKIETNIDNSSNGDTAPRRRRSHGGLSDTKEATPGIRKRKIETNIDNSSNGDTAPRRRRSHGGTPSSHAVSNSHQDHNNENSTPKTPSTSNGSTHDAKVSAFPSNDSTSAFNEVANKYHYSLAEMIVLDNEPVSVISRPGFTRFMKQIAPYYEIPSSTYLSQTIIPDMDARICNKIKTEISEAHAITLTSVTLQCSDTKSYLRIMAHWLSPEFKLQHGVLAIKCLPPSHPENDASKHDIVDICGIEQGKIHLIIHDTNADLIQNTERSATCFIQLLQRIVTESIEAHSDVKDMITAARQLVRHVNSSPAIKKALKDIQKQQHWPEHELVEDNVARWNSTYNMAERLLKAKVTICLYVSRYENIFPKLTVAQWSLMGQWVELLKMFENVAKEISSVVSCISEVIPHIDKLQRYLDNAETVQRTSDLIHLGTSMKNMLKDNLCSLKDKPCFKYATFLDPRFKSRYLSQLEEKNVLFNIIGQYIKQFREVDRRTNQTTNLSEQSQGNIIKDEIIQYLREDLINSDPYEWWTINATQYPNLARLAKIFLCAPCSVVFNEVLSSENKRCEMLSQEDGAKRMLLQYNLPFVNFKY